jgi:Flp pilus assembly protein TadG
MIITRQLNTEDRKDMQSFPTHRCKLAKVLRSGRKKRRGAAVVEFAIVAPLFFLLVFGMIEYGRMVMVQQIITSASREGARQAVLDGSTATEVETSVDTFLNNVSVDGAIVTITPDPLSNANFGDPVTVRVSVGFAQVSWLPSPMFLGQTNLAATTVMRRESVQ